MPARSRTRATSLQTALLAALASVVTLAAAQGCVVEPDSGLGAGGSGAGSSGEGGGGGQGGAEPVTPPSQGAALFAGLEADFLAACGACHDAGGIADTPFLAGPDRYKSVLSWPGLVVKDWQSSLFVTYAITGGGHSGKNLDASDLVGTLKPAVEAWLEEEAKGIPAPGDDLGPALDPFAPIDGFNAIALDKLGEDFAGMELTFNFTEISETAIELAELQVHPRSDLGVHVVHPLFSVYPQTGGEGDPDPIDSFSNVDQYFAPGVSSALSPGTVLFTHWQKDGKLSVAFQVIAPYSGPGEDPTGGETGCKDVDSFLANARDRFQQNCASCHGGNNAQAKNALDMSALTSDPAIACAQIKNRVSPAEPPASQIFITTDPGGNAAHPFKFGGNAGNFNNFRTSVALWIAAEQ